MADLPPVDVAEVAAHEAPAPQVGAPAAVAASLEAWVTETCDAEAVVVRWVGLGAEVADAAVLRWIGDPCRPAPAIRLVVTDPSGAHTYTLRPQLDITVATWVAPSDLQPGEAFRPVRGTAPLHRVRGRPDVPTRAQALRPIRAGTPLHPGLVRALPDQPSGAPVDVLVRRGPIEIRAPGVLVGDGFVGRNVRVRNAVTGAVQRGTLADPSTVVLP